MYIFYKQEATQVHHLSAQQATTQGLPVGAMGLLAHRLATTQGPPVGVTLPLPREGATPSLGLLPSRPGMASLEPLPSRLGMVSQGRLGAMELPRLQGV